MKRYIEAEEVEKRIDIVLGSEPKAWDKKALKELKMYIVHAAPSADVVEVGKWIDMRGYILEMQADENGHDEFFRIIKLDDELKERIANETEMAILYGSESRGYRRHSKFDHRRDTMKIYVVTKGEYSDYHIIAATLSKQRAENIAKICSDKLDKAEVEEFEEMSKKDIDVMMEKLELRFVFNIKNSGEVGDVEAVYEKKNAPNMSVTPHDIAFSIAAKDKEHAIKIARDLRYKYYAEKYGL